MVDLEPALEQIRAWEQKLRSRGHLADAEQLAISIVDPRSADPEAIWSVLWDKPLYANTRVQTAHGWINLIRDSMKGAWPNIGPEGESLSVRLSLDNGRREFVARGQIAEAARCKAGRIALRRLYSIQGAALALQGWSQQAPERPVSSWAEQPLSSLVPRLRSELGRGWGHITVLHFLTDLGLAVKPDLHLVRSMRALGLVEGNVGPVPTLEQAVHINRSVAALAVAYGPVKGSTLRYLDKLLMDASRHGLLEEPA